LETTRADFRQSHRETVDGLKDLAEALAITPIHREFPQVAVEVPIIAADADEVHRIAALFGKTAKSTHHNGKLQTRFKARFGDTGAAVLHVFAITND
jgi:hypothetical protein